MVRRMGSLDGRVAVVTGGVSGLGRASARRFAMEGADLVLADLDEARGAEAVASLITETGCRAEFVATDVTQEPQVEVLMDGAVEAFGRLDVVLAAAGVSNADYVSGEVRVRSEDPEAGFLLHKDLADWNRVLDVNLSGVMLTARAAARRMIDLGNGGAIINIASVAGRLPLPGAGDYCVSKAGVIMLTAILSRELIGYDIRVNAIGPGFIETPMTAGMRQHPEGIERVNSLTPMQRFGTPDEIANTALFLASDESSYFTGQTLFPNGGMFVG